MKINPLTEAFRSIARVNQKDQDQGPGGNDRHGYHPKKDQDEADENAKFEITDEKVGQAVQAFQQDTQAQHNGLSAAIEGKGPGLKVVLKDGGGAVVRQFTGEEFLRLRQAVNKDSRTRGKILDQKL